MLFHFFKILIFLVVRGLKGQKLTQNDKKFCLSHSISQEPYLKILIFQVFKEGGERAKMALNYQFQSVTLYILRTAELYNSRFLVHRCKIMISPEVFLYFFKKNTTLQMLKFLPFFIGPLQQFY